MGIFGKPSIDTYKLQKVGDEIYFYIEKWMPIFGSILLENIDSLLASKPELKIKRTKNEERSAWPQPVQQNIDQYYDQFRENFSFVDITDKNKVKIIISAYIVWSIGAYINGQKLLNKNDQLRLCDMLTAKACVASERDYYNVVFKTIMRHENNKAYQAANVIEQIMDANNTLDAGVSSFIKTKIAEYFVPLMELSIGRIGVEIEKIIGCDSWQQSYNDVVAYYYSIANRYTKIEPIIDELK